MGKCSRGHRPNGPHTPHGPHRPHGPHFTDLFTGPRLDYTSGSLVPWNCFRNREKHRQTYTTTYMYNHSPERDSTYGKIDNIFLIKTRDPCDLVFFGKKNVCHGPPRVNHHHTGCPPSAVRTAPTNASVIVSFARLYKLSSKHPKIDTTCNMLHTHAHSIYLYTVCIYQLFVFIHSYLIMVSFLTRAIYYFFFKYTKNNMMQHGTCTWMTLSAYSRMGPCCMSIAGNTRIFI